MIRVKKWFLILCAVLLSGLLGCAAQEKSHIDFTPASEYFDAHFAQKMEREGVKDYRIDESETACRNAESEIFTVSVTYTADGVEGLEYEVQIKVADGVCSVVSESP